jgi:hypothetical protein
MFATLGRAWRYVYRIRLKQARHRSRYRRRPLDGEHRPVERGATLQLVALAGVCDGHGQQAE